MAQSLAGEHKTTDYLASAKEWQKKREERLREPDGWLSIVGLEWLNEGENSIGSGGHVKLPSSIAENIGFIFLATPKIAGSQPSITFQVAKNAEVRVDGHAASPSDKVDLKDDTKGSPTLLQSGTVTFFVIKRGSKWAVRVRDSKSEIRAAFKGSTWFDIAPEWRITAKWIPYADKRTMRVPDVLGNVGEEKASGYVEFQHDGKDIKLYPVDDDGKLFFIFRDSTAGHETYGAARFLNVDIPKVADHEVVLDFNRAFNPPCAFNPFTTCPLPPPENRMTFAIRAGEKSYIGHK